MQRSLESLANSYSARLKEMLHILAFGLKSWSMRGSVCSQSTKLNVQNLQHPAPNPKVLLIETPPKTLNSRQRSVLSSRNFNVHSSIFVARPHWVPSSPFVTVGSPSNFLITL